MAGAVDIDISANWERWVRGFGNLTEEVAGQAEAIFEMAAETLLSRSQTYAHVITGDMLSTGRLEFGSSKDEIEARLVYGGIPGKSGRMVDYALAEEQRGGTHAYMTRAWEATEREFAAALPQAWDAVVSSWS